MKKENKMLREIIRKNAEFERHLYKQYISVIDIYRNIVEDLKTRLSIHETDRLDRRTTEKD